MIRFEYDNIEADKLLLDFMKESRIYLFRLLLFACTILMMISCHEKKQFDGYLYPIRENGLYGLIDSVGNRIIEPEFL